MFVTFRPLRWFPNAANDNLLSFNIKTTELNTRMKLNRSLKTSMSLVAAMGSLALAADSANAIVIFTEDFEDSLAPSDNLVNNWPSTDFSTVSNMFEAGIDLASNTDGTTLGDHFGLSTNGGEATADLGSALSLTFADNTTYTLDFTHFGRDGLGGDAVTATIMTAGGSILKTVTFALVDPGDLEIRTLSYSTSGGAEVSEGIQIRFAASTAGFGNQAGIDNIVLDETAIPEPSAAALLGLGGLALIRRRRRR